MKNRRQHSATSLAGAADELRSFDLGHIGREDESVDKSDYTSMNYSVLSRTQEELIEDAVEMILETINDDLFVVESASDCREAVRDFVGEVAKRYTDTPYHSFKHGVDVMQMMYFLTTRYLETSEVYYVDSPFCLLIAALCHDIGHFGVNNEGLRKSRELQVQTFGEKSPLEHYHLSLAKTVVQGSELFTSKYLKEGAETKVLTVMSELILWTDMERHAEFMREVSKLRNSQRVRKSVRRFSLLRPEKESMPSMLLAATIKVCDLANVFRTFEDTREWANLLNMESTGKTKPTDEFEIAKFTFKFMSSTVTPMLEKYAMVSKEATEALQERLSQNMQNWSQLKESAL